MSATDYNNSTSPGTASSAMPAFTGHINSNGMGVTTLEVPYQARTKCSLVLPDMSFTTTISASGDISQPALYAGIICNGLAKASSNQVKVYRSFRDDFQLSYFLNTPMILVNQT